MRSQPVPERWPMHAQRRRHGRRPPPPPALHLHLRGGESSHLFNSACCSFLETLYSHRVSQGFTGQDCDEADPCSDLQARTQALNEECCNEPGEDCSSGRPASCNAGCARVLLPFFDDCGEALGPGAAQFDDVYCQPASFRLQNLCRHQGF